MNMDKVTSKDGTTIAFDKIGKGPAVILVGGALQYRSYDQRTQKLAELLGKHFTTFHYDRRGRGDSTDTPPYVKEREIEDLDALIREAGGSAMVFAMSSGGALALDAANSGLKITRLALYEPSFIVDDSRPVVPSDYVETLTKLASDGKRGEAVEYFMVNAVGMPAEYLAPMRQDPTWAGMESVAHTLAYDASFTADVMRGKPLPADRWALVKIPTLVMDGGASPEWVHNATQALARVLKRAQLRTLEGQQHAVAPEVLVPILDEFFRS
jgi:pimeloyl-ACP methyl ester carboxylesterase